MKRSLSTGVLSVVGAKVVVLFVTTLSTPILVRLLGMSRYGVYGSLLSIFALYMIVISSGITDGVRKFLAEERAIVNWDAHVVGFYFRLATLFAVAGALVLVLAARTGFVAWALGPEFTVPFYVLAVLVVTAQFRDYARRTLMGFGLERYSEPLKILDTVSFAAVSLSLVAAGFGVLGALAGHLVASVLVAVIGLVAIHRRTSLTSAFDRPPSSFPRMQMMTFNSMSIVLVLLLTSLYHIDMVMLQLFTESETVGNYKAALTLAEFLWFVPIALQTVYVHSTSELWSNGRHRKISELASRTTRYTLLLTAVMAVGLGSLADVVVPIYFGPDAASAVGPLLLLLPGALGFALARPILAISQGKGRLRYPVVATGTAAAINLTLNAALIPQYGMHGAAVATSIGYATMFVFHCWSARRVGFDPLADARLVRSALATAVAAVPIVALANVIANPWLALAVVPPVGLMIFLVAAVLAGALDLIEPFEVLSAFPGPVGSAAAGVVGRLDGDEPDDEVKTVDEDGEPDVEEGGVESGPVAEIRTRPPNAADRTLSTGDTVFLNASRSYTRDGKIVEYGWDIDDDGVFESYDETIATMVAADGEFSVTLRVTADDGTTDTEELVLSTS